ncbi:MAG TPA: acetyl-CoA carboxylase biotin carboxyl carrier protein [Gemmatimonadetes bacterium]|nr:acetyl-CoA carboxylase, biotin carboxyl carrier protein [Gemmatimonadota bacterium]HAT38521.1 acetyl-CoA carboxylase biotin carboxyl carrier protein [Gemmatimonadota bacterium]|tara:strand:- start:12913 stop:13389 length:477 start_codon:yes stop_codon:yes gene_type:complete
MIDLEFIERLIRVFDDSGVDSLEIERTGTRVSLSKTPPYVGATSVGMPVPVPAPPAGAASENIQVVPSPEEDERASASHLIEVTSPMVGTFYRSPAPDTAPFVDVGSKVAEGETLCIIEAMKLMNELECEVTGTITEICIEDAQPVEFGQVLFRVDPS